MKTDITTQSFKVPSSIKVDNLRHIHDHGLAVEFSDAKLSAMVDSMKHDGTYEIKAGVSKVTVRVVGRVTYTRLYMAVGSVTRENIHYFSPDEDLKSIVKDTENESRVQTLKSLVFGVCELPSVWNARNGAEQDEARVWLTQHGACIHGEAFMRSLAIDKHIATARGNVGSAEGDVCRCERAKYLIETRDIDKEVEDCGVNMRRWQANKQGEAKNLTDSLAKVKEMLATPEMLRESLVNQTTWPYAPPLLPFARVFGATYEGEYSRTPSLKQVHFAGVNVSYSHEQLSANYTATFEGEKITLSSGIVCPFTTSRLLAWLKGEQPAPSTQYGTCSIVEAATPHGTPIKLIKCGCHYVDLSTCANDEIAELCKPTHTVTRTEGTAPILAHVDTAEFIARCEAVNAEKQAQLVAEQREELKQYAETLRRLRHEKANKQATIDAAQAEIDAAQAKVAQAKEAFKAMKARFDGVTLDSLKDATAKIVNVLLPRQFTK